MSAQDFYVYEHWDSKLNEPVYVGKRSYYMVKGDKA